MKKWLSPYWWKVLKNQEFEKRTCDSPEVCHECGALHGRLEECAKIKGVPEAPRRSRSEPICKECGHSHPEGGPCVLVRRIPEGVKGTYRFAESDKKKQERDVAEGKFVRKWIRDRGA